MENLSNIPFKYKHAISVCLLILLCLFINLRAIGQTTHGNTLQQDVIKNALELLGVPYEAGTLDKQIHEKLTWHQDRFDCVTYVEYVLAKSIVDIQQENEKPLTFDDCLIKLRYRNGTIIGYGSRLHYFTEWIKQFVQIGNGINITKSIGGIPYNKKINYMTKNHDKYPNMSDTTAYNMIVGAEKSLQNTPMYYIPKNKVQTTASKIQNGDIIAITTYISGLDIVHTGFAIWQQNQLHLLHASSEHGFVMISQEPLASYLAKHKSQSGIMVIRPEMRFVKEK